MALREADLIKPFTTENTELTELTELTEQR